MSEEGYEQGYVNEAFATNWIAPVGKNIDEFEEDIKRYLNTDYAVALSSGTAAIHLGLKALGVQEGDKVACQTFTFSATANPIHYLKAKPIFIDSELETWNMSPDYLKKAIIENPDIKAVIVVNLYGVSAKLDEIKKICTDNGIKLLEDAAESLGSKYKGKYTGTYGDVGVISFNGNKIITTSGGGMLVTNKRSIAEKVRYWATQSREPVLHYEHKEVGYNYRLSNLLAGVGRGQMKVLSERIKKKEEIFNLYNFKLKKFEAIKFMPTNIEDQPNFWLSCIVLCTHELQQRVIKKLDDNNVETRPLWKPMHKQPVFSDEKYVGSDIAEMLFYKGLCLPSDTKMTIEDQEKVIELIEEVLKDE